MAQVEPAIEAAALPCLAPFGILCRGKFREGRFLQLLLQSPDAAAGFDMVRKAVIRINSDASGGQYELEQSGARTDQRFPGMRVPIRLDAGIKPGRIKPGRRIEIRIEILPLKTGAKEVERWFHWFHFPASLY